MSKHDFSKTYGDLQEGVSINLADPEIQATIREISHTMPQRPRGIHNGYYTVWVIGSAIAIFVSFFLGSVAYN